MTCLHTIILGLNTFDKKSWTTHVEPCLAEFLVATFGNKPPAGLKIYHEVVDLQHDVTPTDAVSMARLEALAAESSTFYVLTPPTGPGAIAVSFSLLMISVAIGFLFPKDKKDPGRPPRQGSANNTLSNRQNQARLLGKVPDMYGSVRGTPDLVQKPWIYYLDHIQKEVAAMCLGYGQYEVNPFNVFEGDMRVQTIKDMSVEIYHPGALPGIGIPNVLIGDPIGFEAYNVYEVEGVAGQIVFARNAFTVHGAIPFPEGDPEIDNEFGVSYRFMAFGYLGGADGRIFVPIHGTDVTEVTVSAGDILELRMEPGNLTKTGVARPKTAGMVDQSGFIGSPPDLSDNNLGYVVVSVTHTTIFFLDYAEIAITIPPSLQVNWANLVTYSNLLIPFCPSVLMTPLRSAPTVYTNNVGPFFVDDPTMTSINCNFVAERGLYVDDTKNTHKIDVNITVTVTPASAAGVASGPPEEFVFTLSGSSTQLTTRAITAVVVPSFTGRCLVQAMRSDFSNWRVDDPGQDLLTVAGGTAYPAGDWAPIKYKAITSIIQDEVKWTQCYSFSSPAVSAFGNTTVVLVQTAASKATNIIKDRKLSMLATRQLSTWNGVTFGGPLTSTEFPEDIFFSILKDPQLGNLPNSQIDFAGIAAAFQAVRTYFGDDITRFGHTFDSENTTLEDMLSAVAESCFCIAYREGQVIKVKPDIAAISATVLFNHRNILQDSDQTFTSSFGTEADYDGVKVDYFDDSGNTIQTVTVPGSSIRPREITIAGLRDSVRASIHAWRAYNRILYQNTGVQFTATQEAALCLINDKILVADVTRAVHQDGDITFVSGTTVRTSQPVSIAGGSSSIFLQHTDGTVESIAIVSSPDSRTLVLASAPAGLIVNDAVGVVTKYMVVVDNSQRTNAFMLTNKTAQDRLTWEIEAHNYSHGYYFVDALHCWIAPKIKSNLQDASPYGRISTLTSTSVTSDVTRGIVYSGTTGSSVAVDPAPGTDTITGYTDYTKAVWVNKNATGTAGFFLSMSSIGAGDETFFISASDVLRVTHNGTIFVNVAAFPLASWHHVVATFNSVAGVLRVFIDGNVVAEVFSVTQPIGRTGFRAIGGFDGKIDDARLYRRAMDPTQVKELYLKTKL